MNKKLIKELSANMSKDHISESSAQCSYYTILSFIPFIILLITMIQYTGIAPQTLFDAISKIIPSSMSEMVLGIVQEVYSKSIGTISVSIIFTIWAAGKGLYALTSGLHGVYETGSKKVTSYIYLRIKALLETIMFIFLIVIGLTLLVFGNGVIELIKEHFNGLKNYNIISSIITEVSFIFVTFIVFLLLYKFMPNHKVTFRSQIYGAIFGAIALNVISFVFSRYLTIFKGFSITYGSLTTLMLIMMWTYSCFYTVFLGAELNKVIIMSIEEIKIYILVFFIYAVAGWIMESTSISIRNKKFVNRGFLIGPVCPIYGYGVVLVSILLKKYQDDMIVTFFMSIIICGILEYLTSFFMEKIFNARWWDYSQRKFNINGRVCLQNLVLFGIASCVIVYIVNPFIIGKLRLIPSTVQTVIILILLAIHLVDNIVSYKIILNLKQVSKEVKDNTIEISEKVRKIIHNKSIFHRRLVNAFPNIKEKVNFKKWTLKEKLEDIKNQIKK